MDEDNIKLIIDNKISEAKLEAAEKRLQTVSWIGMGLLAVFGVAVPLWLSFDSKNDSRDRVNAAITHMAQNFEYIKNDLEKSSDLNNSNLDRFQKEQIEMSNQNSHNINAAIKNMQAEFKELAGLQLRKPILECIYNGKLLNDSRLNIKEGDNVIIEVRNIGDAPTDNLRIKLYANVESDYSIYGRETTWEYSRIRDEDGYNQVYEVIDVLPIIYPKESKTFDFTVAYPYSKDIDKINAYLKIFYGQPEPKKVNITFFLGG